MESIYDRTSLVLGDRLDVIKNSKILLIGVGGVGGYVFEMLCRIGVLDITVMDADVFATSNLNRQVLSTLDNIGRSKVEVAVERAESINNAIHVSPIFDKLTESNVASIVDKGYDYVIDAIDDVNAKVSLMRYCREHDVRLLSCMGTGNRYGQATYEVTDISKTSYDRLARKIRNELKKYNIYSGINVCYTKAPLDNNEGLGSVVYHPLMCAGVITTFVVNELIK